MHLNESKCFYCYNKLDNDKVNFHPVCSKKIFGTIHPPSMDFGIKDITELAINNIGNRISIPGVQPKLSIDYNKKGKENRLTIVGLWGRFILKPPFDEYPLMPEIEDLTMHLATLFGISTAEHSLIRLQSGELAYISKRFDRVDKIKLHLEDMAQLFGVLTENKYRGSMEKVGKIILKYSDYPGNDSIRLFEITLFSYLTGNSDMHLKNFSLLRDSDDEIILSPAYDLLSTKLLIPADTEELALTLNGKKNKINKKDFDQFAEKLQITGKTTSEIYHRYQETFNQINELILKSFLDSKTKEKYYQLISDRYRKLFG